MTSHDVINKLRKKYHQKKFGHTGTLDPEASGVLVVLCGKACKVLQFLSDTDKRYISEIQLGYSTTSDDIFGETLEEQEINMDFDFEKEIKRFIGKQHQKVPMTSAKKINGKKLMDYQRENIEVEPVYADIEIYDMKPLENLSFEIFCSSGTYVRSVCRDFGENTGNKACMKSLVRTQVGRFTIDMAQEIEDDPILYPTIQVLDHFEKVELDDPTPIYQGKTIRLPAKKDVVCIVDKGEPIAIYERLPNGYYHSKRGLW